MISLASGVSGDGELPGYQNNWIIEVYLEHGREKLKSHDVLECGCIVFCQLYYGDLHEKIAYDTK